MPHRQMIIAAIALCILAPALGAAEPQGVELINSRIHWRYCMVRKTEQVRLKSGEVQAVRFVGRQRTMQKVEPSRSALPPDNWREPDFDDAKWPRRRLPVMSTRGRIHSLMCARAQFRVGDPARIGGLTLAISYRGGVVAHLNGKELTRAHMPKGKIDADTPSADYTKDAYLDPDGFLLRLGWGDTGKYRDRFAGRDRHLKAFTVPAATLRKGVNTLALELHRPATDIILHTGKARKYNPRQWCPWATLGLKAVTLSAGPGAEGLWRQSRLLHVANVSPFLRLFRDDEGDPCRDLRLVRIRGTRNGAFSAQVLVSSAAPIKNLKAAPAIELKGPGGATIPSENVQIRYLRPDGPALGRRGVGTFEGLAPSPPETISVAKGAARAAQPVWITVHVPKDAAPGDYKGSIRIIADDTDPADAALELSVADWTLNDPKDWASWFGLVQSPESLAMHYKVPMWSEKHWALIGHSFELMAQLGARIIYVPLIRESCFGNEHSMIRWIRKGPRQGSGQGDGWDHDFSIFERYVDTAFKRLKKLDVICIHSWGRSSGGAYFAMAKYKQKKGKPFRFSVVDPKTGALTAAEGPLWTDKDAVAFFKPVFDGIRERLRKRGLDKTMMVGIGHDVVPSQACVDVLRAASGGAKWVMHCHPRRWTCRNQPIGYLAHVWGSPVPTLDPKRRRYGWKEKHIYATFPRYGSGTVGKLYELSPPAQYRVALESAMCAGMQGYGWIGADFWPVIKGKHSRYRVPFDRYPDYDRRGNLGISHAFVHILKAGADGPVASIRLEMVREGAQETEARVFIERALHDPAKKAKLGADLATRCQKLLDDRIRTILRARSYWDMLVWIDWEKQTGELYALAAEVAAKPR